ncbi:MAG: bacillithiol biosynthesis BshC [Planctomycetota bacterium]
MTQPDFVTRLPHRDDERVFVGRAAGWECFGPVPRNPEELRQLALARTPDPARRARALEVLLPVWRRYDLPIAARAALDLAADPRTHFVLTGQQPGLGGGPLHLFVKAISVARLARRLRELGVPTVALFWIADEDHDVAELFPGSFDEAGRDVSLAVPFAAGRTPIAALRLAATERDRWVDWVAGRLPVDAPHRGRLLDLLAQSFDPAPGVWFRNLLHALLPDEGLLPIHPSDVRPLQGEVLRFDASRPDALSQQIAPVVRELAKRGLPVPIPRVATPPFFWIGDDGGRHRLEVVAGGVRSKDGSRTFDPDALDAEVRRNPQRFSPDALLRPLLQDAVLEPFATVVGPTEFAYHLELAEAYAARAISRPLLIPRLRVRLLDRMARDRLLELGVSVEAATAPSLNVAQQLPSETADRLERDLEAAAQPLLRWAATLGDDPRGTPALQKRLERLRRRWTEDLDKLARVIERDCAADVSTARKELERIHAELFPGSEDAERTRSVFHYLGRYGPGLLGHIAAAFDPFDDRVALLALERAEGS